MRLVSWNCAAGFHRKAASITALEPDIAVISECAAPWVLGEKASDFAPTSALWVGTNPQKGLAVFSFGAFRLTRHRAYDRDITYALPARVDGPLSFNVLAIWVHPSGGPATVASPGPTLQALAAYKHFLRKRPSIVTGDLNNHIRWDRPGKVRNHANAVAMLRRRGFVSAYHEHHGCAQGEERHPTIYWRDRTEDGPTYHIDYTFLPRTALPHLRGFTLGAFTEWTATGLSDHVPLIVDLDPAFADPVAAPVSS